MAGNADLMPGRSGSLHEEKGNYLRGNSGSILESTWQVSSLLLQTRSRPALSSRSHCLIIWQDLAQPLQLNGLQTTQLLHQADGDVERAFCSEVDAIYVDDHRLQEMALAYATYRWATGGRVGLLAARGSSGGAVGVVESWRASAVSAVALPCCKF